MKRWKRFETAYAVVRVDLFQLRDRVPDDPQVYVKVKDVFWAREEAEAEVERLNRLNANKDCHYHWDSVHVSRRDVANPS